MANTRRTCSECGHKTRVLGGFCPNCGKPLPNSTSTTSTSTTKKKGGSSMKTQKNPWIGVGILVIVLIFILILAGMTSKWLGPVVNNQGDIVAVAPIITVDTKTVSSTSTETTTKGLDLPSKSWFIGQKGSLVSGDVAIFDNDNNSKKIPIYDNLENTADVIVLGDTVYLWAEWGCCYTEKPTQADIDHEINKKLSEGFTTVRFFDQLTRSNYLEPTALYTVAK